MIYKLSMHPYWNIFLYNHIYLLVSKASIPSRLNAKSFLRALAHILYVRRHSRYAWKCNKNKQLTLLGKHALHSFSYNTIFLLYVSITLGPPDEHVAVIQPFGGRWNITCSPKPTQPTTALTWETADGLQLEKSSYNTVHYSAPAEVSQELVCYGWSGEQYKTPLQFVSLIIPGKCVLHAFFPEVHVLRLCSFPLTIWQTKQCCIY